MIGFTFFFVFWSRCVFQKTFHILSLAEQGVYGEFQSRNASYTIKIPQQPGVLLYSYLSCGISIITIVSYCSPIVRNSYQSVKLTAPPCKLTYFDLQIIPKLELPENIANLQIRARAFAYLMVCDLGGTEADDRITVQLNNLPSHTLQNMLCTQITHHNQCVSYTLNVTAAAAHGMCSCKQQSACQGQSTHLAPDNLGPSGERRSAYAKSACCCCGNLKSGKPYAGHVKVVHVYVSMHDVHLEHRMPVLHVYSSSFFFRYAVGK